MKSIPVKALLLAIVVLLAGIFGVLAYQAQHKTPSEKIQDGLNDAAAGASEALKQFGHDIQKSSQHK